jgi:protein TonB
MAFRRYVHAAILSLGVHAVLLVGIGAGWKTRPESKPVEVMSNLQVIAIRGKSTESPEPPVSGETSVIPATNSPEPKPHRSGGGTTDTEPFDAVDPKPPSPATTPPEGTGNADGTPSPPEPTGSTDGDPSPPGVPANAPLKSPSGNPIVRRETEPEPLEAIVPVYPSAARRSGLEGVVLLDVTVTPSGRASEYRVLDSKAHKILVRAAADAVMNALYEPGTKNGRPVEDQLRIRVVFDLDDG